MIQINIEEDNKNFNKKSRDSSTIMSINIVEEALTKDKKIKNSNRQKLNKSKRNSRATITIVVRLVKDMLTVMLE